VLHLQFTTFSNDIIDYELDNEFKHQSIILYYITNILPEYKPIHPVADISKESSTSKQIEQLNGDVLDESFLCGRRDGQHGRRYADYTGDQKQLELYTAAFKHHYGNSAKYDLIFYLYALHYKTAINTI